LGLQGLHRRIRREIAATDLCEAEELARLRGFLDQQLSSMQSVVSRLANKLQRLLLASRTGIGSMTWRKACWMPPASPASSSIRCIPVFKREKDTTFRDTLRDLAAGQFRLVCADRPIMVAADVRGHPGTHPGTGGREDGRYWATTRAWERWQAREKWLTAGKPRNRAGSMTCAHNHLQSGDEPWRAGQAGQPGL